MGTTEKAVVALERLIEAAGNFSKAVRALRRKRSAGRKRRKPQIGDRCCVCGGQLRTQGEISGKDKVRVHCERCAVETDFERGRGASDDK